MRVALVPVFIMPGGPGLVWPGEFSQAATGEKRLANHSWPLHGLCVLNLTQWRVSTERMQVEALLPHFLGNTLSLYL